MFCRNCGIEINKENVEREFCSYKCETSFSIEHKLVNEPNCNNCGLLIKDKYCNKR